MLTSSPTGDIPDLSVPAMAHLEFKLTLTVHLCRSISCINRARMLQHLFQLFLSIGPRLHLFTRLTHLPVQHVLLQCVTSITCVMFHFTGRRRIPAAPRPSSHSYADYISELQQNGVTQGSRLALHASRPTQVELSAVLVTTEILRPYLLCPCFSCL